MAKLGSKSQGPLVLVVEDNPDLRRHLTVVLKDAGFGSIHAHNEKEALAMLRGPKGTCGIGVIIADINLSEGGGTDQGGVRLAEGLAERRQGVPIILISYDPEHGLPAKGSKALEDFSHRLSVRAVLNRNSDSFNRELVNRVREVTRTAWPKDL